MFSSKVYPFPYTKNKSKEFYCRCYVVKLFLHFSFFISPPFQCLPCISCYEKNFYYFLGGSHLFVDSNFHFLRKKLERATTRPALQKVSSSNNDF